jgi:glutamate formiminotransferase/formiminotetrahydrofolate cyclodeaminase
LNPLVECVPNFSEGRRPEVVESIVEAIRAAPGVSVLDCSRDADHNRSVVTFVGTLEGVEEAAFAAIARAADLIDMTRHSGQHPRIGATDVVPIVPICDVEMAECVEIARRLGRRVGEELGIPVYLYEAAATRPERVNLENVRRGEYEGLHEAIGSDPDRAPDFGPARLGKAGATVIGARPPLIAYNVYLNTDDVEAAKRIAHAVRHSGGGLRFVKALGLLVDGWAQVSMNLTDYRRTPIHRVQELIRVEAARHGCQITHAELVGLIPEGALIDSARWYLQLDLFDEDQILERRLHQVEMAETRPLAFLEAVASSQPTPGGGSVAALAGALSAALGAMVARTTLGKPKFAAVEEGMCQVVAACDDLRARLTKAIQDDGAAFDAVLAAYRLPKDDPARPDAIQAALIGAADVPLSVAQMSVEALEHLRTVARLGNPNAASDAAAGAHMALAAVEAAALNVLINAKELSDQALAGDYRQRIDEIQATARPLAAEALDAARQRGDME